MNAAVYVLFRRRTLFLFAASVLMLVVAKPTPEVFWIGLPFVAGGEAIRVWSAGYLTKLSGLVTAGPFALCRNPLYIGSFLISVGYFIMCHRIDVWILGTTLFWLFHGGAVIYEERLLREKFGEEYTQYCKTVPRFIPHIRDLGGAGRFSLSRVMANDEYRGAVTTVVVTALYGFMAYDCFSILSWLSDALPG